MPQDENWWVENTAFVNFRKTPILQDCSMCWAPTHWRQGAVTTRFKKLSFTHDTFLSQDMRRKAERWFKEEFNKEYKDEFSAAPSPAGKGAADGGPRPVQLHVKRHKANTATFFADSDASGQESEGEEEVEVASRDELTDYLALAQIKYKT